MKKLTLKFYKHPIEQFIKLRNAILKAHVDRKKTIDVMHYGSFSIWNSLEDTGWQEYKKAREILAKYPFLEKLLLWFNLI